MATFIKINDRRVVAADVDFNFIAMLSENNINLNEMGKKMLPTIRVYVAYSMGVDVETAGALINQHMVNGGTLEDITKVFMQKCEDSDFFRAISENDQTETTESNQAIEVESEKVTKISKKKTTEA
jgi:hypothetical protein